MILDFWEQENGINGTSDLYYSLVNLIKLLPSNLQELHRVHLEQKFNCIWSLYLVVEIYN